MKVRVVVLVLGLAYLALAAVGFAETGTSDFSRNPENVVLGFGVSTLLNVVHAATGVLAVGLAATRTGARVFGMLGTIAYTALFAYGVVAAVYQDPGEPLNVTWADNWLHLGTALVCMLIVMLEARKLAGTYVDDELWQEFHRVVNMSSRELDDWLRTRSARQDTETLPDQSGTDTGQRVLSILRKRRTDLDEADVRVMRNVVERVRAERRADLEPTPGQANWRRKLMSLGHDPLKAP